MDVGDLRPLNLFSGFTDEQLSQLVAASEEVRFTPGQILFTESTPAESWWVLIEGRADLIRHVGREDVVMAALSTPGQWSGGFLAWDPNGVYMATAVTTSEGRALRLAAGRLRELADTWTPFGVHLIRGLMQTVRNVESTARQRESLVALGRISAGLAHEINNPASAAARAVDVLESACSDLSTALRELAIRSITAEEFVALDELRRGVVLPSSPPRGVELAEREDVLYEWLGGHDVGRDWVIAPVLAAAGLDPAWCERVALAVDGPTDDPATHDPATDDRAVGNSAVGPALEWIAASLSIDAVLGELKDATGRISGLVSAVRSYSQMDRASMQQIDVTEGIDSTLVMLGERLRDGIEVVREYAPDVPRIEASAGELNQVWTNLIDNAVDAMDGKGTLRISTSAVEGRVVIEVADSGPGMTPDIAQHAFDAFFTTKDVGKGTGLGLDITRRIVVERHTGEISVRSRPGETVFRVVLPVRHLASRS